MSQFNPVEKSIAYVLSFVPGPKKYIKWTYQLFNFLVHRRKYRYQCSYQVEVVNRSPSESFFGYYDKSPENIDGSFTLLQESVRSTKKMPTCNESISILLKENRSGKCTTIAPSHAYNWQQGAKLHWLDKEKFIFNFFDSAKREYKAAIYRTDGTISKELGSPMYDTFAGEYALSLNFDRLNALRPDYGYRCRKAPVNVEDTINDGVFLIDLERSESQLLISLEQLTKIRPLPTMKDARHKVNHIMIAPNGERFMFMHRWITGKGKRYDRLMIADKDGNNLKIVVDDDMVSHCCWYENHTIVGYLRHNSHGATFYRIDLDRNNEISLLSDKLLHLGDGHPSFHGNLMVFDSYPDRARMKHLYLYDIEKDELKEVGAFFESMAYFGETRCDLHPRWSPDGNRIYIDSVHEGKRKLYKIQLRPKS